MTLRRPLLPLIVLVIAVTQAPGADSPPKTRRPPVSDAAAQAAVRERDAAEAKARAAYDKSGAAANADLVKKLEVRLDALAKASRLDDAVAVRDLITVTKTKPGAGAGAGAAAATAPDKPDTAEALAKAMVGTQWKKANGTFTVTFAADMGATSTHHRETGTWAAVDGQTIRLSISMNTCGGALLRISPDGKSFTSLKTNEVDFVYVGN